MENTITKTILLRAPIDRVWRALSDSKEFGYWFGMDFEGPFARGRVVHGRVTGTKVDPEVAKMQDPHKGIEFDITIERMEPEKVFSYRWHPGAVDPGVDYSKEPTTLVEFTLEKVADGVQLTVTESGFDQIPLARRAKAFAENEGGWTVVIQLVGKYLEQNA
jgi:uncharacterized protein YndB with AHSA1/START domain